MKKNASLTLHILSTIPIAHFASSEDSTLTKNLDKIYFDAMSGTGPSATRSKTVSGALLYRPCRAASRSPKRSDHNPILLRNNGPRPSWIMPGPERPPNLHVLFKEVAPGAEPLMISVDRPAFPF